MKTITEFLIKKHLKTVNELAQIYQNNNILYIFIQNKKQLEAFVEDRVPKNLYNIISKFIDKDHIKGIVIQVPKDKNDYPGWAYIQYIDSDNIISNDVSSYLKIKDEIVSPELFNPDYMMKLLKKYEIS